MSTMEHKNKKPYEATVLVTPEIAAEWLRMNHNNRPLRKDIVEYLAGVIKSGGWTPDSGRIVFLESGLLVDGQHRLSAIVKAGIAVFVDVKFNAMPECVPNLDTGEKRTPAEQLRRLGFENSHRVTACARSIFYVFRSRHPPSHRVASFAKLYLEKVDKGEIGWAMKTLPANGRLSWAPVVASVAIAYRTKPSETEKFAVAVQNGPFPNGSAEYVFASFLASIKRSDGKSVQLKTLRAIRHFIERTPALRLVEETKLDYWGLDSAEFDLIRSFA